MLFNSIPFICVFVPLVSILYFLLGRYSERTACFWLCAASLAFYGYWNIHYVPLLLGSIVFNFTAGYLIGRNQAGPAKWLLTGAITADLGLLGYYKYAGFFVDAVDRFSHSSWSVGTIILPLGISFFTFTQIAYLVDVYRHKVREYSFAHYLLFVTYFPHLIAGPILHHAQMMPQFAAAETYRPKWRNIGTGLTMFVLGLFKKVLLADTIATIGNTIFNASAQGHTPLLAEAWIGTLAYTLQLYFDFSGYCDMAIGVSLILNIQLPINFNSPYKAINIIDFWRRWHITLSTFLRDYLYIPLGGNRMGGVRRYANLLATMLLGGLWHGAGWTFVLWGGLHGLYLVSNHAFRSLRAKIGWREQQFGLLGQLVSSAFTFGSVAVAWSIFRAQDLPTAARMLRGLSGANGISVFRGLAGSSVNIVRWSARHGIVFDGLLPKLPNMSSAWVITLLVSGLAIVWGLPNTQQWVSLAVAGVRAERARRAQVLPVPSWHAQSMFTGVACGIVLALLVLYIAGGAASEFLYFQF